MGFSRITWSWYLILLLGLTGCFEGAEDCLDARALNFSVTADTDCPDCCTYPTLGLNFAHKMYLAEDTLNLEYQQPYANDLGQYFTIEQLSYYLSGLRLLDPSGNAIEVEERLQVPRVVGSDTTFVETVDHFALVRPEVFNTLEIGTLIYTGEVSALQFTLGIPELIQAATPDIFTVGHPLAEQDPPMYDEESGRYLYNRMRLRRDTLPTTAEEVIQITDETQQVTLTLPLDIWVPNGFNVRLSLEVDYLSWFAGVDFAQDDASVLQDKLVANLAGSFRLLAVDFTR